MFEELGGSLDASSGHTVSLLRKVFENAGVGLCVVDPQSRVLAANAEWLRSTGCSGKQVLGRDILSLFPASRRLAAEVHARARAGEVVEVPRHRQPIGDRDTWWEGQVAGIDMAGGRGLLITARDVTSEVARETERRRRVRAEAYRGEAEHAAAQMARLHEFAVALSGASDLSAVAQAVVTVGRRVTGAVGVVLSRLRGDELELVDQSWRDVSEDLGPSAGSEGTVGPWSRSDLDAFTEVTAIRAGEESWLGSPEEDDRPLAWATTSRRAARPQATLPLRAGSEVFGALTMVFDAPLRFGQEERNFLRTIAHHCSQGIVRADLFESERRHRLRAEEAARGRAEAQAVLDALVQNAPLGIGFWDREMRFRLINRALADMNGLAPEAHLGKTPTEVLPGLDGIGEVERCWRQILATGDSLENVEVSGETPAEPGRRRTWRESWYPVRTESEIIGIGGLVREVTAEKQAEEFRTLLLGIVGHDLRSPLSVIIHGLEALDMAAPLGDQASRLVERMQSSAGRMLDIIELLLDFTLASHGEFPLERKKTKLDALCAHLVGEALLSHPERQIDQEGEDEGGGWWDPRRLSQVIANLLDNALKHSPAGSPVSLRWRGGTTTVIEVTNQGPPIPPEILPTLFDPLRRVHAPTRRGLGLGLFISQQIVIAHGGSLWGRSDEQGTVFTVRLPTSDPDGTASEASPDLRAGRGVPAPDARE